MTQTNQLPGQPEKVAESGGTDGRSAGWIVPDHVIFHKLGEDVLVANLDTGMYHTLNSTAARIWELLQDHDSAEEIARQLDTEYEADMSLLPTVVSFCRQMQEKGLVEAGA